MFSIIFLGFNLRTTFRINTTPDGSYKTWRSQRSAVSYDAFKALIKSDIVPPGQRKDRLMAILDHLDIDIMGLTRAREVCIKLSHFYFKTGHPGFSCSHLKKALYHTAHLKSGPLIVRTISWAVDFSTSNMGRKSHAFHVLEMQAMVIRLFFTLPSINQPTLYQNIHVLELIV